MPSHSLTRRNVIRTAGTCLFARSLCAAPPFWNRKAPQDWTPDEIEQILGRSPWARETNIDFEATEGAHIEPPTANGAPPQPGEQIHRSDAAAGSLSRAPVVVRWESAQPLRDAMQLPPIRGFEGRYAIGVSNIPPEVMNRHTRGSRTVTSITQDDLLAELQGAASLSAPGRDPAGAGIVKHIAGSENNYLFGFDKDLLPLTGKEKEILFVLHTARVSVKAKFEPKNMIYRGKFAV